MATKRLPRPRDPIALAKLIGDIATGQTEDSVERHPEQERGGKRGGRARAKVWPLASPRSCGSWQTW